MLRFIVITTTLALLFGCGSSTSDSGSGSNSGPGTTTSGISIQATVSAAAGGALRVLPQSFFKNAGMPSGCPDNTGGGYSINLSPVDGSLKIATKYVHLLKEGSTTDYYSIPACEHSTAAEAETNAVTIESTTTTICELDSAIPEEAVATYDGMEMAIYYVQMTVPMIVPQISADVANYALRIYFNDDSANGILARDILFFNETEGKWGWVNWDDATQLTYVGASRPGNLLDAFANDSFWCADCAATPDLCPAAADQRQCSFDHAAWSYKGTVPISSRDTSGGTDFSLAGGFSIASTSEAHVISMAFDVQNTLTAWENTDDISGSVHTLDLSRDCGFHPLFPAVTITDSKE